MKIVFFFSPTGTNGKDYEKSSEEELSFSEDTVRIYLKGCQHPNIGNSLLTPDLDIAATHIRNAFENGTLNLDKLKQNLGDGICAIYPEDTVNTFKPESIGLNGHSRGAVSTFAVAKKLDDLDIPIDIIANQPVPGELNETSRSTQKYKDLSDLKNIRSAAVFLATHSNYNAWWHNLFFKQLVPQFADTTKKNHFLLPVHFHFDFNISKIIGVRTNQLFSQYGYTENDGAIPEQVQDYYSPRNDYWQVSFIPTKERQTIWGDSNNLAPDPVYLELQHERAMSFLQRANKNLQNTLDVNQAAAIDYLLRIYTANEVDLNWVDLILNNDPKGNAFCHIINTVTETCLYVATLQHSQGSNIKYDAITSASAAYQKEVAKLTYAFLKIDNPNTNEQNTFKKHIYAAEKVFRKDALEMERDYGRYLLKFLTNFILHVSGVGIIANMIHKNQTGNWLFFNHNKSTSLIREMRKELFDEVQKEAPPKPS